MRDWSLRAKSAMALLVISLIPVAAIAVLDVRQARSRLWDDEAALLAARAEQLANEIDRFNEGYQRAAARLAGTPEIVALFDPVASRRPSISSFVARLAGQKDGDPAVRGIALLDGAGRVLVATEPAEVGSDKSFRRYVRDGLAGLATIADPYIARGGVPTIAFVAPVRGADGVVVGLAVFWIRAEAMWALAKRANGLAGAGSFAVIFDRDGVRIAHTYSQAIVFHPGGALAAADVERLVAERRFGADTRKLLGDVRAFPAQFQRARADRIDPALFSGFAPVNQQVNDGVGRRLSSTEWTVFYMVPDATLALPIARLTRQRLIMAATIALLALALGVGFAAMFLRPIGRLTAAADALTRGDLAARVTDVRGDELGTLGRAFNAMAGRLEAQHQELRRSHDHLEDMVGQRTAELVEANQAVKVEVGERTRAEMAVREREQSLATTLDSIGDAVIVTDKRGVVTRMNPVAEELTGWSRADASGRPLGEVFRIHNEETGRPAESPVGRVLRDGRTVGLANHTVLTSRAGSECPIADSAAPILDKDSAIRGVVLVFRDMTAERDAQRALAASERTYRDLYENSPDMHLTAELPGQTIIDCNQTLCDQLGYGKADLIGQPFSLIYHPDYRGAEAAESVAAFQESGELLDVERRLRRKDGSSIEVSLNVRAVRDAEGRIRGARAIWRDITRRKEAERDRQFMLQLSETLRGSSDPIEVLTLVSTQVGQFLAVSRCTFVDIDAADDRAIVRPGYHKGVPVFEGPIPLSSFSRETTEESGRGMTIVIEDTATDPRTAASFEGAYRPVGSRAHISVPLLRDERWIACLVVASDEVRAWQEREVTLVKLVAERVWLWVEHLRLLVDKRVRDVAEAVRHTEKRFRLLVEAVRDYAIYMLDADGNVATWNAGAERLKGYGGDEIIGQHFGRFFELEEREREYPRRVLDRAASGERCEEEGWQVRKDGSRFWASIVITAMHAGDGSLEGFAMVARDVSERKAYDEQLRAKQAVLVQSLKEREVLLQEVHHRVKNNLQVISSLINMQARKLDDGETRDALEQCQLRVLAIALIHEKLYQSKDYAQVHFAEYARSLAANVFHATGVSQQDVSLELAIEEIPLGIDRAIPCGLVINELISNSLKHAFKDGRCGTIRVALAKVDDGRLQLSVCDDGIGLPAGFDIQVSESMGLQLVTTLAEQLGATLVVNGEGGASFQLTFAGGFDHSR